MHQPLIVSDPAVMMGKPVVGGTRVTVELILEKLASGESIEQILDAHPRVTRDGILVALNEAAPRKGAQFNARSIRPSTAG